MSQDNRTGSCITGKVRYADEEQAAIALERVGAYRLEHPDGKLPESTYYPCAECEGWHLSSKIPRSEDLEPKQERESWEDYAHRLEGRIKEQREMIVHLNRLRNKPGNRVQRKRVAHLRYALGRMTERWEKEKRDRMGLVGALQALELEQDGLREALEPFADERNWAFNFDGRGVIYSGPGSNAIAPEVHLPDSIRAALSGARVEGAHPTGRET